MIDTTWSVAGNLRLEDKGRMLTYQEFASLARELSEMPVLSVYIDGTALDPARRNLWRTVVDHAVVHCRDSLARGSHQEHVEFDAAVVHLRERLSSFAGAIRAQGFVAFVTPAGVRLAEAVPTPMSTLVHWGLGARLAPYLAVLENAHPAFTVLVDTQRARLFRYVDGELEQLETLRARDWSHAIELPTRMRGGGQRGRFRAGVRGTTGADEESRQRKVALDLLLSATAGRLDELSGHGGWIVIGGVHEIARLLLFSLSPRIAHRATLADSLHSRATHDQIKRAAALGASELRRERERNLVDAVVDQAATGRGVTGFEQTQRALGQLSVEELLLSRRFIAERPDDAEHLVAKALEQRAMIATVPQEVSGRLDTEAEGVGARLRFTPMRTGRADPAPPVPRSTMPSPA